MGSNVEGALDRATVMTNIGLDARELAAVDELTKAMRDRFGDLPYESVLKVAASRGLRDLCRLFDVTTPEERS